MQHPDVRFESHAEYDSAIRMLCQSLKACMQERLRPEHCSPLELDETFLAAWRSDTEEHWMKLCKGSSKEWALGMAERATGVLRSAYRGLANVHTGTGTEFPYADVEFIKRHLENALDRFLGKDAVPSATDEFGEHNLKCIRNATGFFDIVPSKIRTVVVPANWRRMYATRYYTVKEYKQAWVTLQEEYTGMIRPTLEEDVVCVCIQVYGLSHQTKDALRTKGLGVLRKFTRESAQAWCGVLNELLLDSLDMMTHLYVRMWRQQQQNNNNQGMQWNNNRRAREELVELLTQEAHCFFEANAFKEFMGALRWTRNGGNVPCGLVERFHAANMRVIRPLSEDDTAVCLPLYVWYKFERDTRLVSLALRRKESLLFCLGRDVARLIFIQYKQILKNNDSRVEFSLEAYAGSVSGGCQQPQRVVMEQD